MQHCLLFSVVCFFNRRLFYARLRRELSDQRAVGAVAAVVVVAAAVVVAVAVVVVVVVVVGSLPCASSRYPPTRACGWVVGSRPDGDAIT
ncbi:MAG: hypothetical protein ACPIOQ_62270, partial [Promethearchaeia archaeon]